jgi:uncharacterized protein DUF4234
VSAVTLESLRKDSELRGQTDTRMSVAWIFLPIIAIVIEIAVVFITIAATISNIQNLSTTSTAAPAVGLGVSTAIGLVASILFLYFFYMLIRRRNQHFPRQQRFFSDLVSFLRTAANKKGANVEPVLNSMENTLRQSQSEETEKSAVLWVILMIIPFISIIAILYILYFLTKDYYKHERWEDGMLSDSERAMSALGIQFIFHRSEPIPSRSFILYLIITIITFGIFGLYWEYTLIKDPNNHFANHAVYEPQIIQLLAPLAA